ncbi:MAG TPA: hypothetical protein VEF72_20320 [Mycobacterium sp.]|nr:hypothetical protein [Mycobacterium sp.]
MGSSERGIPTPVSRSPRRPGNISTVSPSVTAGFKTSAAVAEMTVQRIQDVLLVNEDVAGIVLG